MGFVAPAAPYDALPIHAKVGRERGPENVRNPQDNERLGLVDFSAIETVPLPDL